MKKIILASQSPRRKLLLKNITENFETIPSNFDEIWDKNKNLEENILWFSEWKALDVAKNNPWKIVIWCDTFPIHSKNWNYFKPKDLDDAKKMLLSYSWEKLQVLSWLSLVKVNKNWKIKKLSKISETFIYWWKITENDVEEWVKKDEWQWRSWAFSIEWFASKFVEKIDWCFFNIVWLPVSLLNNMLEEFNDLKIWK